MKRKVQFLVSLFLAALLLTACQPKEASMAAVDIGDYRVRLESAVADPYNRVVRYALTRKDGREINPDFCFGAVESTGSGYYGYLHSSDGKTIWLDEYKSRGKSVGKKWDYMLTLEDPTVGDEISKEACGARCQIPVTYQMTQLLREKQQFELPLGGRCQLTSVEISPIGLHLELETPTMDLADLSEQVILSVVMKNGVIHSLPDKHVSSNWSEDDETCLVACEAIFDWPLDLETVDRLGICGISIKVEK